RAARGRRRNPTPRREGPRRTARDPRRRDGAGPPPADADRVPPVRARCRRRGPVPPADARRGRRTPPGVTAAVAVPDRGRRGRPGHPGRGSHDRRGSVPVVPAVRRSAGWFHPDRLPGLRTLAVGIATAGSSPAGGWGTGRAPRRAGVPADVGGRA